eukprot:564330-Ditylum_brightwellii.AAC.1
MMEEVTTFGVNVQCPATISDTLNAIKVICSAVEEALIKAKEKRCDHNKKDANIHALTGSVSAEEALKVILNAKGMYNTRKNIKVADKG